MTRKLRFGIIGCGVIGHIHAEAIATLPDAQLVAVADSIPQLAQELAEAFHVTPYSDFQERKLVPMVLVASNVPPPLLRVRPRLRILLHLPSEAMLCRSKI